MTKEFSTPDRFSCLIMGALLLTLTATGLTAAWGALGLVFVGSAFMNFFPIHRILGIKARQGC